jgi:hypothetical protein
MTDPRSEDLQRSRHEAALLLRLDPSNLSPSDALRCDLVATLRLSIDAAQSDALEGRAADLGRLIVATESLVKLLPSEPPKPASAGLDPRQIMLRTYLEMRRRGELAASQMRPQQRLEAARAKVAEIEAELAAITPSEADITPPGEIGECYAGMRPGPDDPPRRSSQVIEGKANPPQPQARKPFVNGLSDVPQHVRDTRPPNEAWRNFVKIDWQG